MPNGALVSENVWFQLQVKWKSPDPRSRHFPALSGSQRSELCDLPGAEEPPEESLTKQFCKDNVLASKEEITELRKKVKTPKHANQRLANRNETAQEITKEIRDRRLLSEEGSHLFTSVFFLR